MNISVVIPTLGGLQLNETISALQASSIIPREILLCIPSSSELQLDVSIYQNIRVVRTDKKGQVYQRKTGFLQANSDFILQLDDDIILKNNTIEKLTNSILKLDEKSAISPTFYYKDTSLSVYKNHESSFLYRIVYWIMNGQKGFQPGIISLSGVSFDLKFECIENAINESEWLPGGCVLHRKENLITNDYYPFKGKAYAEDLIHSILLRENGVRLYLCEGAISYFDKPDGAEKLSDFFKQYKAAKYVAVLANKKLIRIKIYYFLNFIYWFLKKIIWLKKYF
jgi:glycosyltransferase involved in cell wall biosynthesis